MPSACGAKQQQFATVLKARSPGQHWLPDHSEKERGFANSCDVPKADAGNMHSINAQNRTLSHNPCVHCAELQPNVIWATEIYRQLLLRSMRLDYEHTLRT